MKSFKQIGLKEVQDVYSGPEGELWELIMGEQIHIGGFTSSMDLAEKAGICSGMKGVELGALGRLAANSSDPAAISSMCVVFAETEITGLLASGTAREDIVAGVQASIAARIISMAGRSADPPVIFTGGVAMVSGMADAMQAALRQTVSICPDPQMTGALGAAILASKQLKKAST